jgi:CheY-like chemotaxis protein
MSITLLSGDLMLLSRTQGAANKLGVVLRNATTAMQAREFVAANDCRGLVVDLRTPGLNIRELVAEFRATGDPELYIAACGPHVHEAALNAARSAGCDVVATRGQFERDAEAILQRMLGATEA